MPPVSTRLRCTPPSMRSPSTASPVSPSLRRQPRFASWLVFVCASLAASLALQADEAKLPLHPTLFNADYKGKPYPVVAASGEKPVILVDGKRRTLPASTALVSERGARYHPARAVIDGQTTKTTRVVLSDLSERRVNAQEVDFAIETTVDQNLADCYLVLVTFDTSSLTQSTIDTSTSIRVHELGSLLAGVPKKTTISTKIIFPQRFATKSPALGAEYIVMQTHWQLFSGGAEIRSNVSDRVSAFYHNREKIALMISRARWQNANRTGSRPMQPFLQIPPLLEDTENLPKDATATLTIAADGTVVGVSLDRPFPEEAAEILTTTFGAWLFLPSLKDGQPIASRASIPLKF